MTEFEKVKAEIICTHAWELVKDGRLSYTEFAHMNLDDMAKRLDEEPKKNPLSEVKPKPIPTCKNSVIRQLNIEKRLDYQKI